MNALVPQNFGALASRFQGKPIQNDLAAGVQGGFGLIGYRGKVWSIRYRGEERQLMRSDGDGPRNSIEVVILKASASISKIWYEAGWVEGSNSAPDCFSTNGVTPDVGAAKKQSQTCATCEKNAWGSRITPAGKQGKACSDSKRLAVVPEGDLRNEMFGGPMLLRVPAASLQDMANFANKMAQLGYPYNAIVVRISFDPNESFPKFQFNAVRALNEDEAAIVEELQNGPEVARILAEAAEYAQEAPQSQQEQVNAAFEQPPQQAAQAPVQPNGGQPSPQQVTPQTTQQEAVAPTQQPAASGFGPMAPKEPETSPGTGEASSTPAQPAAATGNPQPTETAPSSASAPATLTGNGPASDVSSTSSPETGEGATPSAFEGDLDAQLDALMKKANVG